MTNQRWLFWWLSSALPSQADNAVVDLDDAPTAKQRRFSAAPGGQKVER